VLIPAKHVTFSESILGLGSYVITILDNPKTIDEVWLMYQNDISRNDGLFKHSFDNMILAVIFLYSIGKVIEHNGKLERV